MRLTRVKCGQWWSSHPFSSLCLYEKILKNLCREFSGGEDYVTLLVSTMACSRLYRLRLKLLQEPYVTFLFRGSIFQVASECVYCFSRCPCHFCCQLDTLRRTDLSWRINSNLWLVGIPGDIFLIACSCRMAQTTTSGTMPWWWWKSSWTWPEEKLVSSIPPWLMPLLFLEFLPWLPIVKDYYCASYRINSSPLISFGQGGLS